MPSTNRNPIYFVGWSYADAIGVPLKRLLMNPASPFDVKGIVHQEVHAPYVDGIPILRADEFLAMAAKTSNVQAVLMVKDELSRTLWLRRGRDAGIRWIDEGEMLLAGAQAAKATGATIPLKVMTLPDALDNSVVSQLSRYSGQWGDDRSNIVFRCYLQFLETAALSPLRAAAKFSAEHPARQTGTRSVANVMSELGSGLAYEIAPRRSSFLDQVMLMSGRASWGYAFSSDEASCAAEQARNLRILLSPLGATPMASWLDFSDDGASTERPIQGFEAPRLIPESRFLRLDVEHPVGLVSKLAVGCPNFCAWIRVGRNPTQLAEFLDRFPITDMALDCDRPGPLGLQVSLRSKA